MKNKQYVVALSFANYLKDKTGMPKVMMEHQEMYNKAGISYVSLFSVKKNILHDKVMLFCKFGLIIDGEFKGVYQLSQIIAMFSKWEMKGCQLLDIHIHHLLYVDLNLVSELLSACMDTPIKIYLHDYYYACTQYNLLREDKYCGGLGLNDVSCTGCPEYSRSRQMQEKIHALFRNYLNRITFISPSETTKNIFLCFHPEYEKQVLVIPHQKYDSRYKGNLVRLDTDEKIKVGFLGMPKRSKGWDAWCKVVEGCSDSGYEFYVFNSSEDQYPGMKKVHVAFSKDNLNAMTDALRNNQIQVVLLWAIWPETYSYTCFEAFSANAFIITNEDSGNIVDVVRDNRIGIILKNESELDELFKNAPLLKRKINEFRETSQGGPNELYENDEIVKKTLANVGKSKIVPVNKLVNYPLLWILNAIYK